MKFRSSKPTEDPLCSKKEKDKMVLPLSLFLLQISKEFHFYLCFVFFRCRNKVLYIYIYIYIYIYALSVHTRSLTAAWVCFLRLNFTPSQIIIAGIFLRRGNRIIMNLIFISFGSFFFFSFLTSALTC